MAKKWNGIVSSGWRSRILLTATCAATAACDGLFCPVGLGCEPLPATPAVAGDYSGSIGIALTPEQPSVPTPGGVGVGGVGDHVTLTLIVGSMFVTVAQAGEGLTITGRIDLATGGTVNLPALTGTIDEEWVFTAAEGAASTWKQPRDWAHCGSTTITSSALAFGVEYDEYAWDYYLAEYTPVSETARPYLAVWESWSPAHCRPVHVATLLRTKPWSPPRLIHE